MNQREQLKILKQAESFLERSVDAYRKEDGAEAYICLLSAAILQGQLLHTVITTARPSRLTDFIITVGATFVGAGIGLLILS